MEIDEHLEYSLYVFNTGCRISFYFTSALMSTVCNLIPHLVVVNRMSLAELLITCMFSIVILHLNW
jgi:hypothetical protein